MDFVLNSIQRSFVGIRKPSFTLPKHVSKPNTNNLRQIWKRYVGYSCRGGPLGPLQGPLGSPDPTVCFRPSLISESKYCRPYSLPDYILNTAKQYLACRCTDRYHFQHCVWNVQHRWWRLSPFVCNLGQNICTTWLIVILYNIMMCEVWQ